MSNENIKIIIITFLCSFLFNAIVIKAILPFLRQLKFGQSIRKEGPSTHFIKSGTPTVGGLVIIIGTIVVYVVIRIIKPSLFLRNTIIDDLVIFFPFVGYGIIGLIDDLLTIKKKQNEGLTPRAKFLLELVVATVFYLIYLSLNFDNTINFWGIRVELGFLYGVIITFLFTAFTNATNFTDGLDGLLGSTALTSFLGIGIYSYLISEFYVMTLTIIIISVILSFLLFNYNKAALFMGDTGSLALGGIMLSMLVYLKSEVLIIFIGGIYLIEILSVMLQVWYFKRTGGKRIFKMTPLHHHFELLGYSEYSIDLLFSIFNLLLCIIGIILGVNFLSII